MLSQMTLEDALKDYEAGYYVTVNDGKKIRISEEEY